MPSRGFHTGLPTQAAVCQALRSPFDVLMGNTQWLLNELVAEAYLEGYRAWPTLLNSFEALKVTFPQNSLCNKLNVADETPGSLHSPG